LILLNPAVPPHTVHAERLRGLVLDWAGTAVDYGSLAPARTLHQLFAQAHIKLTESEIRRDMGLAKKEHIRGIMSIPRVRDAGQKLCGYLPSEAEAEKMYKEWLICFPGAYLFRDSCSPEKALRPGSLGNVLLKQAF
jgi:hypothetical protein